MSKLQVCWYRFSKLIDMGGLVPIELQEVPSE